tara:strand:- start:2172 stop:2828 length:657 start_codon:yes stop_codon:yes gene_type:complete
MKVELGNKFSELNRRVKLTSKARYNASRRLTRQNNFSQWTLALLSVALILISLVSASDIPTKFNENYIDIMQIIFAVLILTYSLLLATGDYSARSVKIHRCGMELGRLARKIKPYEDVEDKDDKYNEFTNDYYNYLEKYENHENVDYLVSEYTSRDWFGSEEIKNSSTILTFTFFASAGLEKLKMKSSIWWGNTYPVSHYFISVIGVYYWLYLMIGIG